MLHVHSGPLFHGARAGRWRLRVMTWGCMRVEFWKKLGSASDLLRSHLPPQIALVYPCTSDLVYQRLGLPATWFTSDLVYQEHGGVEHFTVWHTLGLTTLTAGLCCSAVAISSTLSEIANQPRRPLMSDGSLLQMHQPIANPPICGAPAPAFSCVKPRMSLTRVATLRIDRPREENSPTIVSSGCEDLCVAHVQLRRSYLFSYSA
jgi:hypothetical protein